MNKLFATSAARVGDVKDLTEEELSLGVVGGRIVEWKISATIILETKEGRFFTGTWSDADPRSALTNARSRALANIKAWRECRPVRRFA